MSELTHAPAYWAVIPAKVRYDRQLRPNAKLLYAEITALSDDTGYCWAANEYFAKLFGLSARTASDLIGTLAKRGYIHVEVIRDSSNAVIERRIWLEPPDDRRADPIAENSYTPGNAGSEPVEAQEPEDADTQKTAEPIAENGDTPIAENGYTPIAKNGYKNNKDISNSNNPYSPLKRKRRGEPKEKPDWKPERFALFWSYYPRGEAKQAAIRAWDRLKPSSELLREMGQALRRQMDSDLWQQGMGIPYASTWLNGRRWEDAPPKSNLSGGSGSWAEDDEVI